MYISQDTITNIRLDSNTIRYTTHDGLTGYMSIIAYNNEETQRYSDAETAAWLREAMKVWSDKRIALAARKPLTESAFIRQMEAMCDKCQVASVGIGEFEYNVVP